MVLLGCRTKMSERLSDICLSSPHDMMGDKKHRSSIGAILLDSLDLFAIRYGILWVFMVYYWFKMAN